MLTQHQPVRATPLPAPAHVSHHFRARSAQVNLFKEDGTVIHFENPKGEHSWCCCFCVCEVFLHYAPPAAAQLQPRTAIVLPACFRRCVAVQASLPANTYVISGTAENKTVQELMPGIIGQLGQAGYKMLQESLGGKAGSGPAGACVHACDGVFITLFYKALCVLFLV